MKLEHIARPACFGAMLMSCMALLGAQVWISERNGLSSDELYSLWATSPELTFWYAFTKRFGYDTTPPLYYVALYWARQIIADTAMAIYVLNGVVLAATIAAVLRMSNAAGRLPAALVASSLFVVSGPMIRYFPDGRSYVLALCIAFAASWWCAIAIVDRQRRLRDIGFAVLGSLGALSHLFAGLICGSLAAGLICVAVLFGRRDLYRPGFALGLPTLIITLVWVSFSRRAASNMAWLNFTPWDVWIAFWEVRRLAVGGVVATLLVGGLVAFGLVRRSTRELTAAACIAVGVFIAIPLIASFKVPIVTGRYWTIGAPTLITLLVIYAGLWFSEGASARSATPIIRVRAGAAIVLAAFAITTVSGWVAARESIERKPIWRGAAVVTPLIDACPDRSIRVYGYVRRYAIVARVSAEKFNRVDVSTFDDANTPAHLCRVLGWAEHVLHGDDFLSKSSDADLLRLLKLDVPAAEVTIHRLKNGFVVLRK